jgi:predicted sulfurtransferase
MWMSAIAFGKGSCFVFDERVAVTHGLREGDEILCRACRNPVTPEEQASPLYEEGASCPHCYHSRSDEDRERFRAPPSDAGRKAAARANAEDMSDPRVQDHHCRRRHCRHRHRRSAEPRPGTPLP